MCAWRNQRSPKRHCSDGSDGALRSGMAWCVQDSDDEDHDVEKHCSSSWMVQASDDEDHGKRSNTKKAMNFDSGALDLHGDVSLRDDELCKYSQNGMNEERIKHVLKHGTQS